MYDSQSLFSEALDGSNSTFSSTQRERDSWWRISFKKTTEVHYIVIRNRRDGFWNDLNDFSIFFGHTVD